MSQQVILGQFKILRNNTRGSCNFDVQEYYPNKRGKVKSRVKEKDPEIIPIGPIFCRSGPKNFNDVKILTIFDKRR